MSPFYNDRVFGTREELMDWVQTTARNLGYVIVTQRTKKTVLGFVKKVYLMCDRGGEYKSVSKSTTHSGTKKCGCPFQLIAKYNHDPTCSGWKINVKCVEHNHDPAIFLEGHAFVKRFFKNEFEMVEDMTKKNMAPRDILTQLKKNADQNVSTRQTVYDARQKIRKAERVGQTPMQSMVKSLHTGDYVYHIRQEPDSNQVQDLFFINPISMIMWRAFPHVLILDPTYKTNIYHLPSTAIDDLFRFNENTSEQTYFTNTSGATEYDFLGLSQHNVTDQKSEDYHNYIDQIPTVFHPYVQDITNVLGDGNCGFRATASALGYGEDQWLLIRRLLIDEMVQFETYYKTAFNDENYEVDEYKQVFSSLQWSGSGFAPEKYWMIMPETGFLIANKFNVIFHFISKENDSSSTIFPLWRGPNQFPDKKIITIALVNSNHYIKLEMQGEFPMGFTHNLWRLRRKRDAAGWQNIFKSRQKLYKDWIAKSDEFGGVID